MDFIVEREHLEFLDDLKDSGVTNMYGATPYIIEEFGIHKQNATHILREWMATYSERHPR